MASLARLFDPKSIAVIGASSAPEKAGYQMLRALRGFPGKLYPINPKASTILDYRAYASLGAITAQTGKPIDLAILTIPAAASVEALREAAAAGCGGAIIISGGFGEAGAAGHTLQDELAHICRETGIRLLGPNTSGFINAPARCSASFAPGAEEIAAGSIAVVAQSGGVNLTLAFLIHRLGLGLSLAVGLGNMVDVDAADVLDFLAHHEPTRAIALHLEGVSDGRKLFDALRRVTPLKPVVALAVGRSDVGEFAQSHTGKLIGSYARKITALRQAGAVIVDTTDELADAVAVLSKARIPPKSNPGLGILTGQAGPGLLIVDRLKSQGASVPELSDAAQARIRSLLPPLTFMRNPVDTGRPGPGFPRVLQAIAEDEAIDAIAVFSLHEPAAVDPLIALTEAGKKTQKPLLFGTMGVDAHIGPTLTALWAAGIPALSSPERLALAARVLFDDAREARRLSLGSGGSELNRAQTIGCDLDEAEAKDLLYRYGIASPARVACDSHAAARAAFTVLTTPLVAKILSSEVAHKTEVGGVVLNLRTPSELEAALAQLDAIPLQGRRRYLLEEMAPPGVELIAGAVRDPSFGETVMVGLGGTAAEALNDTALRLAPIDEGEATEMLDELRGRALLDGWRGAPAIDRQSLARAIVAIGRIMMDHADIAAIDVNPLRAYPHGVLALDALMVRAKQKR